MPRVAIAVRDMDRALATFRDRLGFPTGELPGVADTLGIRIAFAAPPEGSPIELMAPLDASRGHSRSLLRFIERRGEGLFAMMLYAPDPDGEAEELEARGLPVMPLMKDAAGRDIHPKDTCGVLIRIYPASMDAEIERELEKDLGPPSARRSAAGVGGIRRVVIAVRDLDSAVTVYRDRLGLPTELRPTEERAGTRSALCRPRSGAPIELVAPDPREKREEEITEFLRRRGEGIFALVLESRDLARTEAALRERGLRLRPSPSSPAAREIEPDDVFGAGLRIEPCAGEPSIG